MAKKVPQIGQNISLHIQKSLHTRSGKTKISTLRYIIVKVLKSKEKDEILKVAKEKQFTTYNGKGDLIVKQLIYHHKWWRSRKQ